MKKIFKQSLAFASLALLAGTAAAGIKDSPHNLTTDGTNQVNTQTSTQQICVFCHTPHGSNTAVTAPLWNKATPSSAGYTTYSTGNSSTIDGKVLSVGSVSAACLSCHDGTQAMDNLVNAPGSGGYVAGGTNVNYTWSGGSAETIGASRVANLGKDLTNDHPIGIQYCGGGITAAATANTNCADKDFKSVQTRNINGSDVFWVDTTTTGSRSKNDIILYTRTFSGTAGPSVECASCHDPHTDKASAGTDVHFMRVTTAGSAICLACHTK